MSIPPVESKGRSPFFPDQPVPLDLFIGRLAQIERIMERGVGQVVAGKPVTMFLQGDYGIGKTSIARFTQRMAEKDSKLLGIYVTLDRAETIDDLGLAVLKATVQAGTYDSKAGETIRNVLAKYIGEQSLFGITLHAENLRADAPSVAQGLLPFLKSTFERVKPNGFSGIFLVFDEINGIAANPKFAHYLKALVDSNAALTSGQPIVPLLMMLTGTEERRGQIIGHHEPVARIFDIIQIETMSTDEMRAFFLRAFESVNIQVHKTALETLAHYAAGLPKIMHLIGNSAFWQDRDGVIDDKDAIRAVIDAADEVGKRFVDQQVFAALKSEDYHSILQKIANLGSETMSFSKRDVESGLTTAEKKKFNNFLQRMKKLDVLSSGDSKGEYCFNVKMVQVYIWLKLTSSPRST